MKNSTKNAPQQKNSIQIQDSISLKKLQAASNNINNQQKKIQENKVNKDNKENITPNNSKVISQIKQLPVTNKISIEKAKVIGQGLSNDIIQIKPSAITKEYFNDTKKVIEFCKKLGLVELKNSNEGYSKKLLEFSTQLLQKKSAELTKLNPTKQQKEIDSTKTLIAFLKNVTSDYPDIYYGSKSNILDLLKNHNVSNEFTKEQQETISIYLPLAINTYYFRVVNEQKEFKEFRELVKENDYFLEETNREIYFLKEELTKKETEIALLKKEDEISKQLIKDRDDIIKKKDDVFEQLIKDKENEIITIKAEYEAKCQQQEEIIQISRARQEEYEESVSIKFQQLGEQMGSHNILIQELTKNRDKDAASIQKLTEQKDRDSELIIELTKKVSGYDKADIIKINTNKDQGFWIKEKYEDSDNENEKDGNLNSSKNLYSNKEVEENNLKSIDDLFDITAISTCCEEVMNSMISIIEHKEAMGDIKYIPSNLE
jgi:hypothetical protein